MRKTGSRIVEASAVPTNAAVISRNDLMRMKNNAVLKTEQDLVNERLQWEAEREQREQKAVARKKKMLQMEAEAKAKSKKSDIEIAQMARDQQIRKMAEAKMTEETDMVKLLNTLGARAAAFTIRDQQLEAKKQQKAHEDDYERRMDLLMELERLKQAQAAEEEVQRKQAKRLEDRQVILQQIETRAKHKLLAEEAREQENKAMLAQIAKFEEQDRLKMEQKKKEMEQTRLEVMAANERAILMREEYKRKEKEEEEAILLYQAQRDEELRLREEAEIAKQKLMKERQAKLLAQQEKVQNKQAEMDEVRARRAAEEKERRERRREVEQAERQRREIAILQADRKRQAEQKRLMMMKEAEQQLQEYEHSMAHAAQVAQREAAEDEAKRMAAMQHRKEIMTQIDQMEEKRRKERQNKTEEGVALKQEFLAERAKLGAIRDKMVNDMAKKGVNPKYLAEMQMADIQKLQMR